MLHNLLLDYDGYLKDSYDPDENLFYQGRGDGLELRRQHLYTSGVGAAGDEDVTIADEASWFKRIKALAVHVNKTS